jgi:hypothetical protein
MTPKEPNDGLSVAMLAGAACAALYPDGQWLDGHCSRTRPCLCEHGASSSPAFDAFAASQKDDLASWTRRTFLGLMPSLILLPVILVCGCSRTRRSFCSPTPVGATSDQTSARLTNDDVSADRSERSVDHRTAARLAAAQRAAMSLRNRVSGTIAFVGWALCVLGLTPMLVLYMVGVDFSATAGNGHAYFGAFVWGVAVLILALRPIDAARITIACRVVFAIFLLCAMTCITCAFFNLDRIMSAIYAALALLFSTLTLCIAPTILSLEGRRCARATMSPRRQLLRLWLVIRILLFGVVCILSSMLTAMCLRDGHAILVDSPDLTGILVTTALSLPAPFLFTSESRGLVHRWLGALGKSGSQQQEAAAVAALIGRAGDLAAAMKLAMAKFLVLPLTSLTAADLSAGADLAVANSLSSRVRHAKLGECDAFMSHSWRDDGAKKYDRLVEHQWATTEPTLWLDKVRVPGRSPICRTFDPILIGGRLVWIRKISTRRSLCYPSFSRAARRSCFSPARRTPLGCGTRNRGSKQLTCSCLR